MLQRGSLDWQSQKRDFYLCSGERGRSDIHWVLAIILAVLRTVLEDRRLRAELPGYKDYAQIVRFRLLPGIW